MELADCPREGGRTTAPGASPIHSCSTNCRLCRFGSDGGGGGKGVLPSAVAGGEGGTGPLVVERAVLLVVEGAAVAAGMEVDMTLFFLLMWEWKASARLGVLIGGDGG